MTQNNIDGFTLKRGKEVKRTTLNKDIRNIKAFIRWCQQKKYINGNLKIKVLKEDERPVKLLTQTDRLDYIIDICENRDIS